MSRICFLVALCAIAQAQQTPVASVAIPTSTANIPLLADFAHGKINVVGRNTIATVGIDGTVLGSVTLPTAPTAACIDPNSGMIAAGSDDYQAQKAHLYVADSEGVVGSLALPEQNFGSCTWFHGLIYISWNLQLMSATPKVVAIDPTTMTAVKGWYFGDEVVPVVQSSTTGIYAFSGLITNACVPNGTCQVEMNTLNDDGSSVITQVFQNTLPSATTIQGLRIAFAPNGMLFVKNKVFDAQGLVMTGNNVTNPAWPDPSDPWFLYETGYYGNGLNAINYWTSEAAGTLSSATYTSVVAQRQPDGTDLVIAQRDGALDFYRVSPEPLMHFVANAASLQPGSLAPGSLITIKGQGLGTWGEADATDATKITTKVGGTQAFVDNQPLRLLYVGYGQINAALPQKLSTGTHAIVVKSNGGATLMAKTVTIVDQSIAAFMWTPDPTKPTATAPIVTNQAYQVLGPPPAASASSASVDGNDASGLHPQAQANDVVTFWATGGGITNPPLDDSVAVVPMPPVYYYLASPPQVLVDGNPVAVLYAGLAPGNTPGLNQVNFIVPAGLASGAHDVTLGTMKYPGSLWIK